AKTKRNDLIKSAENGSLAVCFLLIIATISLIHALLNLDFSLKYVALNASSDLATIYRITALWGGQAGSLLLWCLILSIYTSLVVIQNRRKNRGLMPYVLTTLAAVSAFFIFLIAFVESPFEKLPFVAEDGRGLNPILQNAYMAIHPLTLYLGYVGVTVPFAFGMGALLSGKFDDEWIRQSRKWALVAWTFLSLGLLLGARWAYLELGWGGYWAWDPVENAAFMPWLAGTAFVHSVMIQEKRGMLKKWNLSLIILTFFLAIFGTFITRSGIISSVHSFAQSDIGPYFLGFIGFILLFSFSMFISRIDDLKSENHFDSILSRESAFIFNNLLFLSAAFTVFLGTIFPIISELITREKILVGPPYFNRVNVPIGLVLILLMGIGPLISWRRASIDNLMRNFTLPVAVGVLTSIILLLFGMRDAYALISFGLCAYVTATVFVEYYRGIKVRIKRGESYLRAFGRLISKNRRRYGGYIVHLGVVLIVIGITASSVFVKQKEGTLKTGESMSIGAFTLRFDDLSQYTTDAKHATAASLSVFNGERRIGTMVPEKNLYKYSGNREINQETEVAILSSFKDDLYVILTNFEGGSASFRVLINPMISWIWAGGVVLLIGAIVTMWPAPVPKRQEVLVRYSLGSRDRTAEV
ncbi:MAG: heme lyase CcmF/NrfE family subunit, partial [Deltaproteobacteria bacterium]|nr:heme lyase CcmF/NrfE family subunit [Deltaproteobacteria bacterium]